MCAELCSRWWSLTWAVISSLLHTFSFTVKSWEHNREGCGKRVGISGMSLVIIVIVLITHLAIFTLFGSVLASGQEQIKLQNSCAINTRAGFPALLTVFYFETNTHTTLCSCAVHQASNLLCPVPPCTYGVCLSSTLYKAGQYYFVLLKFSELV